MNCPKITNLVQCVTFLCTLGLATQTLAAPAKSKVLPDTLTTEQGRTYNSVRLLSTDPDGLVIEYKPQAGGLGMAKVKFRNLPESLRQEFNYNEGAAADFEAARGQALAEWRERQQSLEKQGVVREERELTTAPGESQSPRTGQEFPVGRFRAAATVRGAMIVDTVTGEAWLLDLHSVLNDFQDRQYFLQPKVMLPPNDLPKAVLIGP